MQISSAGNLGAAVKSLSIIVPPGRKGIEPKISLNYNSNFQNGWLGIGWNLDMGAIQRSTKRDVNYSANDYVETVNGSASELAPRTNDWGANYYGAKIEGSFSKYYKISDSSGWEVTTKDGTKYYYGTTLASRQENTNGVFRWYLDKVQDTNGNYMTITYEKDIPNGEIYLSEINYTGNINTSLGTSNKIRFLRGNVTRTDAPVMFTSKALVRTEYLLRTIDIFSNDVKVRAYKLTYTQSSTTSRSLLSNVQEYGYDASGEMALPSISYEYFTEADGKFGDFQETPNVTSGYGEGWKFAFADVNGDGRADAIANRIGNEDNKAKLRVKLASATEKGKFDVFQETSDVTGYGTNWKFAFADVNGDGRTDAIAYVIGQTNGYARLRAALASITEEGKFGVFQETPDITSGYGTGWNFAFADVNGDGRADAIAYRIGNSDGSAKLRVALASATEEGKFGVLQGAYDVTAGYGTGWNFAFSDVNGDGRADAIAYRIGNSDGSAKLRVKLSVGDNFDNNFFTTVDVTAGYGTGWKFAFADVNGDGRADAIAYRIGNADDSAKLRVKLSIGNGTFDNNFLSSQDVPSGYGTGWKFAFADVNGDGMTDAIARYIGQATDDARLRVKLSSGDGKFGDFQQTPNVTSGYGTGWKFAFSDVDGDGKSDAIAYYIGQASDDARLRVKLANGDAGSNLLKAISNGIGAATDLTYMPSSAYDNCFVIDGKDKCLPFVLQTLSKAAVDDGNSVLSETNYTYAYGYIDIPGREFRGFGYVKSTAPDLSTSETWFHQDSFRKGMQNIVEAKDPSGLLLSRTTLTWENPTGNPAWAFVKLNQKRTDLIENGATSSYSQEDFAYDDTNGNLISTIISGPDAETITAATQYQNYGVWVWRPIKTTVTGSVSGKVRETYFGYESLTGNELYREFWLNSGTNPKIETTLYDSYGNPKIVEDARDNETAFDYDTLTYTYPVKITYPQTGTVTHIIEIDYNYKYGKPNWTKDENGNFTYYTYDKFGRIKQVDNPDGGQITIDYYDTAVPIYTVTKVKENASGQTMDKYGYFDGLGRSIQTITFGEAGKSIVTKTHYNNMGRVYLTEGPFFSAGTGYPKQPPSSYPWVQTLYDFRGRPDTVTSPDIEYSTVTTSYDYSGLSSTITDPDGKIKVSTKDYLGRLIEVKEYGDNNAIFITTYSYNAAGDLKTVTDQNGNLTSINYDTLGRKINMQDPDMGYWQYTYYPNGSLWTQTDAKDQTITFYYDELNRITTKTYSTSDPTITYTYDNLSIPNGRGMLYSLSNTKVTNTYNSYDKMGRVQSVTKTITGAPAQYTTLNEYDLSGKTTKTTYPDNFFVTNSYYPGTGLLEKVTGSNGAVYAANTLYEPAGSTGQINHQNGTATRYTYDSWSTKLTAIVTTSPSSNGNPRYDVINRGYSYSRAGDINTITDFKKGAEMGLSGNIFNYQYTYDNIHRLAGEATTNNTYNPAAYTYDATGNFVTKSAGANAITYTAYDPLHKHAVKTVSFNATPYNYIYDANGNMTNGPDFTYPLYISTRQITYNADNMPVQVTHSRHGSISIIYDGEGGRAQKVSPSGTTYYIGDHYEIINGVSTKYIFAGNLRVAKVTASGTYYFYTDHLGSSSAMTDSSGAVVETTGYMPFGEQREHTGIAATNYKFTGQELDPETGLYYYRARYYDSAIGRFISADTIVPEPFNPQSLNRYSYVLNSPVNYIDPSGHGPLVWGEIQDREQRERQTYTSRLDNKSGVTIVSSSFFNFYWKDHSEEAREERERIWAYWGDSSRSGGSGNAGKHAGTSGSKSNLNPSVSSNGYINIGNSSQIRMETKCGNIPIAPPGIDINKNIQMAANRKNPFWFYKQVHNKGPWDYKQLGKQLGQDYQDFGNFNYGATGSAFSFPDFILYRAAGWANQNADPTRVNLGSPLGRYPYGDDYNDQYQIRRGIDYCECMGY